MEPGTVVEELKESESSYRSLVDQSPDGVAIHAEGKILFVNRAGVRMLGGKSESDLIGKPTLSFVHPDSLPVVTERIRQMMVDNKPVPLIQEKFVRLDGSEIDVEVAASPIYFKGKKAIQVVIHDITESKRVSDELRKSEQRYRSLAEASHDMIFVLDKTGRIEYVNTHAAQAFDMKPEEMIGKNKVEFFGKDVHGSQNVSIGKVFTTGESVYHESKTPFKNKVIWLGTWLVPLKNEMGEIVSVMGISRNITQQKNLELELRQSEASYRGLFDSVAEAIYIQDKEGKFLDVNLGAEKMYGYPRGWFIGKSPLDVSAPDKNDLVKIKQAVDRAFVGEPQKFEFWGVRKTGEVFPKEVRLYKGVYFGQNVVIALAIDITERKRIERMRDEFTMIAAHELRAPMTAIKWLVSMILGGSYGAVSESIKSPLSGVAASIERLVQLVNDMINVTRIEGGNLDFSLADFDIKKLLDSLMTAFVSEAKSKGLSLKSSVAPGLMVQADSDRAEQVLANLIDNAIKFNKEGGEVVLAAEKQGDFLDVKVTDTGIGISEEDNGKLFVKFGQISNKKEGRPAGTGLGLFISRELMRGMGGDLAMTESAVGKGSTFVCRFLLSGSDAADKALANLTPKSA